MKKKPSLCPAFSYKKGQKGNPYKKYVQRIMADDRFLSVSRPLSIFRKIRPQTRNAPDILWQRFHVTFSRRVFSFTFIFEGKKYLLCLLLASFSREKATVSTTDSQELVIPSYLGCISLWQTETLVLDSEKLQEGAVGWQSWDVETIYAIWH